MEHSAEQTDNQEADHRSANSGGKKKTRLIIPAVVITVLAIVVFGLVAWHYYLKIARRQGGSNCGLGSSYQTACPSGYYCLPLSKNQLFGGICTPKNPLLLFTKEELKPTAPPAASPTCQPLGTKCLDLAITGDCPWYFSAKENACVKRCEYCKGDRFDTEEGCKNACLPDSDILSWSVYTDPNRRFSFRYPSLWLEPKVSVQSTKVEYSFSYHSSLRITVGTYYSQELLRPLTYKEILAQHEQTAVDKGDITISGVKGRKYTHKIGKSVTEKLVILQKPGEQDIYWISMSFPPASDQEIFEKIITTFKFFNSKI